MTPDLSEHPVTRALAHGLMRLFCWRSVIHTAVWPRFMVLAPIARDDDVALCSAELSRPMHACSAACPHDALHRSARPGLTELDVGRASATGGMSRSDRLRPTHWPAVAACAPSSVILTRRSPRRGSGHRASHTARYTDRCDAPRAPWRNGHLSHWLPCVGACAAARAVRPRGAGLGADGRWPTGQRASG